MNFKPITVLLMIILLAVNASAVISFVTTAQSINPFYYGGDGKRVWIATLDAKQVLKIGSVDIVELEYDNKKYFLAVEERTSNKFEIGISPGNIKFELFESQTKGVDLDGDTESDIDVTFVDFQDRKARLSFKLSERPKKLPVYIPPPKPIIEETDEEPIISTPDIKDVALNDFVAEDEFAPTNKTSIITQITGWSVLQGRTSVTGWIIAGLIVGFGLGLFFLIEQIIVKKQHY
ncbi:hypothetical protein GOV04_01085 [Candidatus Woesearchaeota archaeon]|nr:hypothetical protein [Candidatus Woesearchaeota archaeon]